MSTKERSEYNRAYYRKSLKRKNARWHNKFAGPLPVISELDKVWLASAFDCEGWIQKKGKSMWLSIEMTNRTFIRKVARLLNHHILTYHWKNPNWSTRYRIVLGGDKAKELHRILLPYLIIKRGGA